MTIPQHIPASLRSWLDTLGICERPWKPADDTQQPPF